MARVALALEFALDQHRSFSIPSRVSTIVLSISACSQTSIPSNVCAMMIFDFAFDSKMSSEAIVWNWQLKAIYTTCVATGICVRSSGAGCSTCKATCSEPQCPTRGEALHGTAALRTRPTVTAALIHFRSVSGMSRQHREQHDYPSCVR